MNYSSALEALADPTRRGLFEPIRERPRTVGELARGIPAGEQGQEEVQRGQ